MNDHGSPACTHVSQRWSEYTADEHDRWRRLFERQQEVLEHRACSEFLKGLEELGVMAMQIPNFETLNDVLHAKTGWRVVPVSGIVPDPVFFRYLSERCFPATCFIRREDQMDYIQEPDIFHDVYGHVPMLVDPVFADYMQAYGAGGLKALGSGNLKHLARLYWYTVEFGLIQTEQGLRIYGSGIVSSPKESVYALESPKPQRLQFDLMRVMRTNYRIDDVQEVYFVINSIKELMDVTLEPFGPIYAKLAAMDERTKNLAPGDTEPTDRSF